MKSAKCEMQSAKCKMQSAKCKIKNVNKKEKKMEAIKKYPRTPHLKGSRLQSGDEDLSQVEFSEILGKNIVIEEKIDGANVGISFNENGELLLQSRGHYLRGGAREIHYDLFKKWANSAINTLFDVLGTRYIMYGEWMFAKHKIYYDNLPSYFLEFDIYDKENCVFLDTKTRKQMLLGSGIQSVPVLASGVFNSEKQILAYLGKSLYITENAQENLLNEIKRLNLNEEEILSQTQKGDLAEGLYIKVEEDKEVKNRLKFVRYDYLQTQSVKDGEWLAKTIIPNKLK